MTALQKERTTLLRSKGESYAKIATVLGLSENTVKSFCRRKGIVSNSTSFQSPLETDTCSNCGKTLKHTIGAKRKRFCSGKCRMLWWNAHPEAVNRKAVYKFECAFCGSPFESYGNTRRKYCSRACFGTARRAGDE